MFSSGALAFSFACRLAEPHRLAAVLAAAAPAEDTAASLHEIYAAGPSISWGRFGCSIALPVAAKRETSLFGIPVGRRARVPSTGAAEGESSLDGTHARLTRTDSRIYFFV